MLPHATAAMQREELHACWALAAAGRKHAHAPVSERAARARLRCALSSRVGAWHCTQHRALSVVCRAEQAHWI
jgi:hypothetical protein